MQHYIKQNLERESKINRRLEMTIEREQKQH